MNPDIETIDFFQWEMDIQVFGFHFYVCKARVLLDSSEIIWSVNNLGQIWYSLKKLSEMLFDRQNHVFNQL